MRNNYDMIYKPELGKLATFTPNKSEPVYNWFYFKEGFSKELVFKFLDKFNVKAGNTVLDPFCGSGTTLLACKQMGIDSIGLDVLPVSVFSSIAKTRDYDLQELRKTSEYILSQRFKPIQHPFPPLMKRAFSKYALQDIVFFLDLISKIQDYNTKNFFLLALINSSIKSSYAWKDGGIIKIRKRPVPPLRIMFKKIAKRMIKDLEKFQTKPCKTDVKSCDARRMDIESNSIDCIITSPPYLNNIDYTKVYEIENFFIGHAMPTIRSYIGLETSETQFLAGIDMPDDARAYFKDMNEALKEMHRACKQGAKIAIVVGNAYYTQLEKHVESDLILAGLAEEIGFRANEIICVNKRFALERRTIKKGEIRESLIVLEK